VRKIFPLAIAMLLALCGAAIAGDNANVVVTLDGATEVAGVGAGATIEVALSGSGLVGVKQFNVTLTVSPSMVMTTSALSPAVAVPQSASNMAMARE
jgi:hypothetical protein